MHSSQASIYSLETRLYLVFPTYSFRVGLNIFKNNLQTNSLFRPAVHLCCVPRRLWDGHSEPVWSLPADLFCIMTQLSLLARKETTNVCLNAKDMLWLNRQGKQFTVSYAESRFKCITACNQKQFHRPLVFFMLADYCSVQAVICRLSIRAWQIHAVRWYLPMVVYWYQPTGFIICAHPASVTRPPVACSAVGILWVQMG